MVNQRQQVEPSISAGAMIAWASVLLAFGSIQGVIYLKAYWGRFGLDPFQYGETSSLALVGLTGIGVTVAVMGIAALVGGCIGDKLDELRSKYPATGIVVAVGLLAGLIALAILVDWGLYLVIGVALSVLLIALAHHSALIPAALLRSKWVPYIAIAVAYVPLASHYYGHRKADLAMNSVLHAYADAPGYEGHAAPGTRLAGRLGDGYVLFSATDRSVEIVPVAAVRKLTLKPAGRADGTLKQEQEARNGSVHTQGGGEGVKTTRKTARVE